MLRRLDPLPAFASLLAFVEAALYLLLVHQENGEPTTVAVAILVTGGAGAVYATFRRAPLRRVVLVVRAVGLGGLGYLAVLSIGPPLLLAAGLCVAAVLRGRPAKDWRDAV